jgi:hypothetical protein
VVIPHHTGDLQLLVLDPIVGAHKRERRRVVKILSLAAHGLLRLRQHTDGFPAAVAASFPL